MEASHDLLRTLVWFVLSSMVMWSLAIFVPVIQTIFFFCALSALVLFFFFDIVQYRNLDISVYLFLPLLLSAVQNMVLGLVSPYASAGQIQSMTVTNIVYACAIAGTLAVTNLKSLAGNRAFIAIAGVAGLLIYATAAYLLLGGDLVSVLASLRNVITPYVFFLLGILAAPITSLKRLLLLIAMLGWFTIGFGFVERFFLPDLWKWLHIADLWQKKGFPEFSPELGVPFNFFSSERINGMHLRRMVSSYADAVNFGTVLVFFMLTAWYSRRPWLALAAAVAVVFAISKAGLVGILIFLITWGYFNRTKLLFPLTTLAAAALATMFVYFSMNYSTRSMEYHVRGFLAAIAEMPDHPFGRGLGNVGVISSLFSVGEQTDIVETGLGMVMGQLGLPGLVFYAAFLAGIFASLRMFPDSREKVLGMALFWSITVNIVFNEVALSPNSAAGYFLVLGLLCAWHGNQAGKRETVNDERGRKGSHY